MKIPLLSAILETLIASDFFNTFFKPRINYSFWYSLAVTIIAELLIILEPKFEICITIFSIWNDSKCEILPKNPRLLFLGKLFC
ncbi:unnamed protein product [Blepharisma stoltei]|uniref:Uncharacterized protein n=1 Tax=Blepharisma stoltei TaxID=1481888 RepID=A0AAU9K936_9CILI|nr:unnamed protein product [Blepharisma stoltei]